jgi:TonB family protein
MGIVLAGLLAVVSPQESQSQVVWKWEPDNSRCVLRQDVGSKRLLEIVASPGSEGAVIGIVEPVAGVKAWKALNGAKLSFEPGETITADSYVGPNKEPSGRRIDIQLHGNDLPGFSDATALAFSHPEFGALRVPVRSPGAAITALHACEDGKLRQWGVDPVTWRALPVKPKPATPPQSWITWYDYPDREKVYKNDITVVVRLDLGADGSIQACTVVNRPPAEFIDAACRTLKKNAKFKPAQDASGKATPAPFIMRVVYPAFHI